MKKPGKAETKNTCVSAKPSDPVFFFFFFAPTLNFYCLPEKKIISTDPENRAKKKKKTVLKCQNCKINA